IGSARPPAAERSFASPRHVLQSTICRSRTQDRNLLAMTLSIRPAEPDRLPDFAGVAEGIDLSRPIGAEQVAAIAAGMDKFAVLVFRDQKIGDEQQLAFSRHFGPLEHATSHGINR